MFSYICQGDQMIRCVKNTSMYSNPLLTFYFMWSQYQCGFSQKHMWLILQSSSPFSIYRNSCCQACSDYTLSKKFTVWPQHLMLLSLIFPIWPLISISEGWNNFDKYLSSVWGVVVMRQVTLLEYYNTACL